MSATAIIDIGSERSAARAESVLPNFPPAVRQAMREAVRLALRHNLDYREIEELARAYTAHLADANAQGNRTHAAKRLGISRRHFRVLAERSKRVVRT